MDEIFFRTLHETLFQAWDHVEKLAEDLMLAPFPTK
jgi:hypothetical protein